VNPLHVVYTVRISPWMEPGTAALIRGLSGAQALYVRHPSEYALLMSGATWHVDGHRCPTYTEAAECRCMLGGEA